MQAVTITQITPYELEALIENTVKKVLGNQKQNHPQAPNERLTRKEVKTEYKISYPTIHGLMNSGELPYEKVGRKTLFQRLHVEQLLKNGRK